jgi:hypothetical protein
MIAIVANQVQVAANSKRSKNKAMKANIQKRNDNIRCC